MPINDIIVSNIRLASLRAFKLMARGRGVAECTFYPASSGSTQIVARNMYHDVIEETGPGKVEGISTYIYIEQQPPIKVVKALGWWKEEGTLPILGYMPYMDNWAPEKSAKIVVSEAEGFLSDTWVVQKVSAYGQGQSCLWVCNIVPKRTEQI